MKEIKLTEREYKVIQRNNVCKMACKKVIEETIKHYEDSCLMDAILWDKLFEKYKLDSNLSYRINMFTKSIEEQLPQESQDILERLNMSDALDEFLDKKMRDKIGKE